MDYYCPDVLISEEKIATRVKALGEQIAKDFPNEEVVLLCVLKGAIFSVLI